MLQFFKMSTCKAAHHVSSLDDEVPLQLDASQLYSNEIKPLLQFLVIITSDWFYLEGIKGP